MEYGKQFVILGNTNAVAYKEFFPLLRDNKVFVGYKSPSGGMWFTVTDEFRDKVLSGEAKATYRMEKNAAGKEVMYCNCPAMWYTNLDLDKSHEPLILTKNYVGNEDRYPTYVNYDAIDCNKVDDIPKDYFGKVGVPITYMACHCSEQFDVIGLSGNGDLGKEIGIQMPSAEHKRMNKALRQGAAYVIDSNGVPKKLYNRIIIQRKPISQED